MAGKVYIENDGALYRGASRSLPAEVWNKAAQAWQEYKGQTPKPVEWGNEIAEDEAKAMMGSGAETDEGAAA